MKTLCEEAIGGGMVPERPARLGGGAAPGLGGFVELRFETLGLDGHVEQRPCPLRDTDGNVGEGLDPLGMSWASVRATRLALRSGVRRGGLLTSSIIRCSFTA